MDPFLEMTVVIAALGRARIRRINDRGCTLAETMARWSLFMYLPLLPGPLCTVGSESVSYQPHQHQECLGPVAVLAQVLTVSLGCYGER